MFEGNSPISFSSICVLPPTHFNKGLGGTKSNDFDLTKERVRQIKEKALRKLRNETGPLFDYL